MIKKMLLVCSVVLVAIAACAVYDEYAEFGALLESNDFERQIELLPQMLEPENFERLFPAKKHSIDELDEIHDRILLFYLNALLETNEDELLRDEIVTIYRSFRHNTSPALFSDLFILNPPYREKLGIIIPEMVKAYEELIEERFFIRYMLASTIWGLLFLNNQHDEADRFNSEVDKIGEGLLIAFDYEKRMFEGEITLDDVSERYRYQVERLIEGRRENGGFDMNFGW